MNGSIHGSHREAHDFSQGTKKAGLVLVLEIRQEEGERRADGNRRGERHVTPPRRVPRKTSRDAEGQDSRADDEAAEDAVVRA